MNYLLEFTICSAVFYGLYLLIFSRLTFIRLNRIYLLSNLVISLCVPLISYQWEETVLINEPIAETSVNDISTPLLLAKNLSQLTENPITEKPFDWMMLLQILYISGIIFMFGKLSFFIIKILKISRLQNTKSYISTKGIFANSSFFNLIFIDDSTLSEPEIEQIMAHERWHIRLYHSYDLLFVEILKIVFWFNPILWFLQKSLSQVHEYEADTRMVQAYHPQTYATLLLKLANTTQRFSPIHQFSRKPLTDRIHFLFTKQKSTPMKRLAYLSILPILGVIFMAFSMEKVVKYRVVDNPDEKYFKIFRKPDAQVNNEVLVKENKVVSNLIYGENRIALTMNPTKLSMDAIVSASEYFKKFGFNLDIKSLDYHNSSKQLDKFELSLTEDIENKKNYRGKKTDVKSKLPSKFIFDLKKMRSKGLDDIITIFADRSTGEHFVASLAPPPPPPLPPPAPVKGKTKLSMNNFEEKRDLENSFFQPKKMKIPTNMTAIKNGIYVENGVVKNADYKAFLDYINQDRYFSKKYAKNMIPENWGNVKNMKKPVIYISFEQSLAFCEWETEIFTYQLMNQKKADYATILKENDKLSKKYKFRLPTEKEWMLIVKKGFDNKIGFTCVLDMT